MARRGGGSRVNLLDFFLIAEFTLVTFTIYIPGHLGTLGVDAVTYWDAAHRWLAGQDPYANVGGLVFAAPPPTLVVLAPFALLPLPAFLGLQFGLSAIATVFLLHRLGLQFWYVLFPPIVEALIAGNPNIIVVALLVVGAPLADALATFVKLYAIVPIALLGKLRSAVVTLLLLVVTVPFLPWESYARHALELLNVLNVQASGGRSAAAYPLLIPVVLVALFVIGRKRAPWLVVPVLWPATQVHYSVLTLPATNRLLSALLALPIPGAPVAAVVADATVVLWRRRRTGAPNGPLTTEM